MNTYHKRTSAGFTLIELLVAVAVVAILMGLVVGISGVANRKSAEAKARAEIQTISAALEEYRLAYGTYPSNVPPGQPSALVVLTNASTRIPEELKTNIRIMDPWGRNYIYTDVTKFSYRLYSHGQRFDTAADDITSGTQ